MAGVQVPLQALAHYYVITEAIPGLARGLPTIKSSDEWTYVKNEGDGLMVGFFEPGSYAWQPRGIPGDAAFVQLPDDWDHLGPFYAGVMQRIPALADAGIRLVLRRAGELHPRRRLPLRRGARAAELLHRCRFQLDRISHRPRYRVGHGRLVGRRTSLHRPAGSGSGAGLAARDQPSIPRAASHRDARCRLRHALAVLPTTQCPPAATQSTACPHRTTRGGVRRTGWVGAAQLVRPARRADREYRVLVRSPELVRAFRGRASGSTRVRRRDRHLDVREVRCAGP